MLHEKYEDIPERAQDLISWTTYPLEHFASKAKAFWQHMGEIPSSRLVEYILQLLNTEPPSLVKRYSEEDLNFRKVPPNPLKLISPNLKWPMSTKKKSSRILSVLEEPNDHDHCTLTVSGMSSIFLALRVALSFHKQKNCQHTSCPLR